MPVGGGGKRFSAVGRMQLLQKAAQKRTLLPSPLHLADQDCLQSVLFSQILLHCNIVRELRRQTGRQRDRLYSRECYGVVPAAVDSSVLYSHSQPVQSTSHRQAVQVPNIKVRKRKSPSPGNHVGSSVSALLLS